MRSSVAAPLLVAGASALPEIGITKQNIANGLAKRQVSTNIYDILAYSSGGAYYANVTVGSPPQNQVVILDTGSSDLYFDASDAQACQGNGPYSCRGGTFNPDNSKTYNVVEQSPAFNTSFGDGSSAYGPYSSDTIGIGDVAIQNVQFGVADFVNSTTGYAIGLMGIGYSLNEATQTHYYPNMPEVLADAGVINSRLYSVYLNALGDISGSILFGGVDTSKYTGDLVTVDIIPDEQSGIVYQFVTSITGASASVQGTQTTLFSGGVDGIAALTDRHTLPVLLDTGSSAWTLDEDAYDQIIAPAFTFVDSHGTCSCSHQNDNTFLTLEFASAINITIPAREFIVPYYDPSTNQPIRYTDGSETCIFMITPGPSTGQGFQTLGDAILRSMYVVYDLDNGQMALAQANTDQTKKANVVKIPAGPGGIASAISSGVKTAASNTAQSIAGGVGGTATFSASTMASTIGTASGTAAVPADAQVTPIGPSTTIAIPGQTGSGQTGSSASPSSSKGAASSLFVPGMDLSVLYVSSVAVFMAAVGAFAL